MRVAFLGNDPWSVAPLRALADAPNTEVELVVTNPPRPAGRGSQLTPTAVADAARTLDLPLLEVDRIRDGEGFDALDSLESDAIVVVAYGEILTPDVLDIPRLGAVNVHFSLLPRWRGAAPVQRAILEGDEVT
jgi:methionyl-tRNA formyltransferase